MPVCAQSGREVHIQAAKLLRHAHPKQAELAGFFHQAAHKAFLVVVEALQQRVHLGGHEVHAGLVHHILLLRKVGGRENVLSLSRLDYEFAAFYGRFVRSLHDGRIVWW
jgi:hypothetical protein